MPRSILLLHVSSVSFGCMHPTSSSILQASAVLLLFLLLVDGNDWLETTSDLLKAVLAGTSVTESAAIAVLSATFYAARHSVLYLALSRWAFEWDRRWYNEAQ